MFNLNKFQLSVIIICSSLSTHAYSQVSIPIVPTSTTYKWKNESDLIQLLDTTTNQALVASQIVAQCNDSLEPLSVGQRQDGYNIAGHTLYGLGLLDEARLAFQGITILDQNSLNTFDLADAWRVLGQIDSELRDYPTSYNDYKQSYDTYVSTSLIEPDLSDHMASYILPFLVSSAQMAGIQAMVYHYVDEAVSIYGIDKIPALPDLVEIAGDVAMSQGNLSLAESYYTDYISNFPAYENDNLTKSTPIRLRLKLYKSQGMDLLSDCSYDSVKKAIEIYNNPAYAGMLARYELGNAIVYCMQENKQTKLALDFRLAIVDDIDSDLLNPANSLNRIYHSSLQNIQVINLYKTA